MHNGERTLEKYNNIYNTIAELYSKKCTSIPKACAQLEISQITIFSIITIIAIIAIITIIAIIN